MTSQTLKMIWQNIAIDIVYTPNRFPSYYKVHGTHLDHFAIAVAQPLPISETGFKSHFVLADYVCEYETPLAYIEAWLGHAGGSKAWKKDCEKSRQLTLF